MAKSFSSANSPQSPIDPAIAHLRIPPHSIEAEQSVLGGLLLDNAAFDKIADLVGEADFYRDEHRRIYRQQAARRPLGHKHLHGASGRRFAVL